LSCRDFNMLFFHSVSYAEGICKSAKGKTIITYAEFLGVRKKHQYPLYIPITNNVPPVAQMLIGEFCFYCLINAKNMQKERKCIIF
jgi:hypothetical protein